MGQLLENPESTVLIRSYTLGNNAEYSASSLTSFSVPEAQNPKLHSYQQLSNGSIFEPACRAPGRLESAKIYLQIIGKPESRGA